MAQQWNPPPWAAQPQINQPAVQAAAEFQEAQVEFLSKLGGTLTAKRFPALRQINVLEPGVWEKGSTLLPLIDVIRKQRLPLTHLALQREAAAPMEPGEDGLALELPLTLTHLRLSLPMTTHIADLGRLSQLQSLAWSYRDWKTESITDLFESLVRMPHLKSLSVREVAAANPAEQIGEEAVSQEQISEWFARLRSLTELKVTIPNEQRLAHPLHGVLVSVDKLPALTAFHVDFDRLPPVIDIGAVKAIVHAPKLELLNLQAEFAGTYDLCRMFARRCGVDHIVGEQEAGELPAPPPPNLIVAAEKVSAVEHDKLKDRVDELAVDKFSRFARAASVTKAMATAAASAPGNEQKAEGEVSAADEGWRPFWSPLITPPVLLKTLYLPTGSAAMTKEGLRYLSFLPNLTSLTVRYLSSRAQVVRPASFDPRSLPLLKHLRTLSLTQVSTSSLWTNHVLRVWSRPGTFPELESISIKSCWALGSTNFGDPISARKGIVHLLELPRLRQLTLASESIDAISFLQEKIAERTAKGLPYVELTSTAVIAEKFSAVPTLDQEWEDAVTAVNVIDRARPVPGGF